MFLSRAKARLYDSVFLAFNTSLDAAADESLPSGVVLRQPCSALAYTLAVNPNLSPLVFETTIVIDIPSLGFVDRHQPGLALANVLRAAPRLSSVRITVREEEPEPTVAPYFVPLAEVVRTFSPTLRYHSIG